MEDQTAKKVKMLKVARDLFVEKGFQETSLDMIIERTGGSRRNIYALFGGKEGLVHAVLQDIANDVLSRMEALPSDDIPAAEWLTTVGTKYLKTMAEPAVVGMFRQLIELSKDKGDIGRLGFEIGPQVLASRVEAYLQKQTDNDRFQIEVPGNAANYFLGSVRGDFLLRILLTGTDWISDEQIDRHVATVVRTFVFAAENGQFHE